MPKRRRRKSFHRGFGSRHEGYLADHMQRFGVKYEMQRGFSLRIPGFDGYRYKTVFVDFLVRGGLVVEVDGVHHRKTKLQERDSSRDARLIDQGKCKSVVRVTNSEVLSGVAIRRVLEWLGRDDASSAQGMCDMRRVRAKVTPDSLIDP